jgi:hypothetical protein
MRYEIDKKKGSIDKEAKKYFEEKFLPIER